MLGYQEVDTCQCYFVGLDAIDSLSDVCRQRELREPQRAAQCCIGHMMALRSCMVPHEGCHRAMIAEAEKPIGSLLVCLVTLALVMRPGVTV